MPLLKNAKICPDMWSEVPDGDPLPDRPAIIPQARWLAERATLEKRNQPLGLRLAPDSDIETIAGDLDRFAVIVIELPSFRDGRAFSQARILRQRHRYGGEIRAVGHILKDQIRFLVRCGVDAIHLDDRVQAADWQAAMQEMSFAYQTGSDDQPSLLQLRHRP